MRGHAETPRGLALVEERQPRDREAARSRRPLGPPGLSVEWLEEVIDDVAPDLPAERRAVPVGVEEVESG